MIYEIVRVSTRETQWRCAELREDNARLHYGRFFLAPLLVGQADLIGSVMRKALLTELEGTYITYVKLLDVPHEYSRIWGVEEPVYDIVMNLKKIVLRSNQLIDNQSNIFKGRVRVKGPTIVTAKDIILNHVGIEVVDNTQHVATLTKPISLYVDLILEREKRFINKIPYTLQEGSYPISGTFSPILNVNYSTHSYIRENERKEMLFLEIWTNGSLTPVEALSRTSQKLAKLLTAPLCVNEEEDNKLTNEDHLLPLYSFTFQHRWELIKQKKIKLAMKSIYIDQFQFNPQVYNGLKKANIEKLFDLLNMSYKDLMKIEYFGLDDVKNIIVTIENYLDTDFDLLQNY
uniref:DNA-directed RNA polymerase n=1 Tax=Amphilophium lactiflorum TaxID=2358316 RepID=A0A411EKB4_9LAMI|nr:RNA polymerase alpha subunit [Amphilophium lactiflorum]QBA69316.1 RNA polymerase alpha subunit [Amphilophium lactiflorum]QCU48085.1 RNA polymerase alpha subunit [Amphilophium lactiflorum]